MIQYIYSYIKNIYLALVNNPVTLYETVPAPLTKEQINRLEQVFPLPVWHKDMTLEEIAHQTGQHEAATFIRRWGAGNARSI